MIKAVLFDFDGTLADTAPDMVAALNEWLAAREMPMVDYQFARHVCSGGSRALLSIHGWGDEDYQDAVREYLQRYQDTGYHRTVLFPGIGDVLEEINRRDLRWGVVTNKPRRYFAPIADKLRMQEKGAAVMICGDDLPQAKPHPLPLQTAAAECGLVPAECLYVGDDGRDAVAAQAAAMGFVAVTWGYWQRSHWLDNGDLALAALVSQPHLLLKTLPSLR